MGKTISKEKAKEEFLNEFTQLPFPDGSPYDAMIHCIKVNEVLNKFYNAAFCAGFEKATSFTIESKKNN